MDNTFLQAASLIGTAVLLLMYVKRRRARKVAEME